MIVDGTDVLACYAAGEGGGRPGTGAAIGPTLIEAKVTRLTAHSSDDQQTKYRSADELAAGKANDPLPRFRAQLADAGVLTDEIEAATRRRDRRDRRGRHRLRGGQPDPDPATAMTGSTPSTGRARRRRRGTARPLGGAGGATDGRPDVHRGDPRRLAEEMRRDESVIVLGEDVGKKGGVFLATDGLWAEFGDDRVIDTPLTESMIVGASIGAAINGLRPVAEIQFADFIHPAFNQLVSEAARMRYRSNNGFGVPMIDPRAVRRRRARRALPLAVGRGVLHPRAGAQGRHPVDAVRRRGAAADRRSATTTRCSSSSTRRCIARVRGEVPDGDYVGAARQARRSAAGHARSRSSPTA